MLALASIMRQDSLYFQMMWPNWQYCKYAMIVVLRVLGADIELKNWLQDIFGGRKQMGARGPEAWGPGVRMWLHMLLDATDVNLRRQIGIARLNS